MTTEDSQEEQEEDKWRTDSEVKREPKMEMIKKEYCEVINSQLKISFKMKTSWWKDMKKLLDRLHILNRPTELDMT